MRGLGTSQTPSMTQMVTPRTWELTQTTRLTIGLSTVGTLGQLYRYQDKVLSELRFWNYGI